jgi:hypothetical protein
VWGVRPTFSLKPLVGGGEREKEVGLA